MGHLKCRGSDVFPHQKNAVGLIRFAPQTAVETRRRTGWLYDRVRARVFVPWVSGPRRDQGARGVIPSQTMK